MSGIIFGFLFPPIKSSYFIFIALVPFFSVLNSNNNRREAFNKGWIFGVSAAVVAIPWIFTNAGAPPLIRFSSGVALLAFVGIYYGLFGFYFQLSKEVLGKKALWLTPLMWLGVEHLLLFRELAFPWVVLANTMTYKSAFIQISEFTGSESISFLIVLFNVLVYKFLEELYTDTKKKRLIAYPAIGIIIFYSVYFWGSNRIIQIKKTLQDSPRKNVVMVHLALSAEEKWNRSNFERIINNQFELSDSLMADSIDLVVWGETNYPAYLQNRHYDMSRFKKYAATNGTSIVLGTLCYDKKEEDYKKYNGAFGFTQTGIIERYDKIRLVPFGEAFPFSNFLPFLKDISLGQSNFDRGENYTLFTTDNSLYSLSICYEGIFSYLNADFANKGSEFFVNISNDAWYEKSAEIYQHSRFNIFRAIENRRAIVRLANRGESSYITPWGELIKQFGAYEKTAKNISVTINKDKTFFTRYHSTIDRLITYLNLFFILYLGVSISRKTR